MVYNSVKSIPIASISNIHRSKVKVAISEVKKYKKRTDKLEKLYERLAEFNPFFQKVEKVIAVCILRIADM